MKYAFCFAFVACAALPALARADAPAPGPSKTTEPATTDAKGDDFRLRIGFNFNGGAIVSPDTVGAGGLGFRIGVQPNALFGLYYQAMPMLFAGFSVGQSSASAGAGALVHNSVMASLTPIDLLEVAAGPSVDYVGIASAAADESGASSGTGGGMFFGIGTRAALHLGGKNERTGRRTSFTIGIDPHFVFLSGTTLVVLTGGLGADWY